MSSKTFTIRKAYVLSAINKAGQRVYYDTDSHSGGYPYWSTSDYSVKQFASLDKIPTFDITDYMRRDVVSIEVLEVKLQAKVVQTTEIMSEAMAKAEAEITQIRKELARKLAKLEGMKNV
jgi:predicted DNA-binding protein YlxM (UPF0122 family)